jgi:glutamate/tyrosine decarboxylase-like PLP-dependent enzyme
MTPEEREAVEQMLLPQLKPYRGEVPAIAQIPEQGVSAADLLAQLADLAERERPRWRDGYASGAVYSGDPDHTGLLDAVYALYSQTNPLHPDLWPSVTKMEAEVVVMTVAMLNGGPAACGTVTSGGTDSILLAMYTYRELARARGTADPEIVAPVTAHAAFDKAAHYFGMPLRKVPVDESMRADVAAAADLIGPSTAVVVGSSVGFPHGVQDPIADLAALAAGAGAGFHTDACLGGFVLPWAEQLGAAVTPWDFRVPGVTSISCDTHKYGYAAKGTSVLAWADPEMRRAQYYATTDWPGGLYSTPTFAGSRSGGLIAAAWAALVSIGRQGYLEATRRILAAADVVRTGLAETPGLRVIGDPLWVIAFTTTEEEVSIYEVMERAGQRGWALNALQHPAAVHLAVTLRHTEPGVAERFVADIRWALDSVRAEPTGGMYAPLYGMAGAVETRGTVDDLLRTYTDVQYRV